MTIKFSKEVPNCGPTAGDMLLTDTSLSFSTVSSRMNTLNTGITLCNNITLNFFSKPYILTLLGGCIFKIYGVQLGAPHLEWVYFQNIWNAVRGMSLTGGGVVLNYARAVRYIV